MMASLDLVAALMSNKKTGTDMDEENRGNDTGCSLVFIAYDFTYPETGKKFPLVIQKV